MSSTPPQQQAVCTCNECGVTKKTGTREVTFNSTTGGSKTKHNKGSVGMGDNGAVGTDRENREMQRNEKLVRDTQNFAICPTPGCVQRKRDRWSARRWKLKNDPDLDDSLEMQNREIEKIEEEEERHYRQGRKFSDNGHTSKRRGRDAERRINNQKVEGGYNRGRTENETESSRQSARDTTRQSDNRSRDNNTQSRQSDQETTANGWGAADADRSSTRSRDSNSQSQQSDQQTTANGWGAADADRSSNRSGENRDAFRNDVDTRASTTSTAGDDAFNVYDDEEQTAAERDAFQDSIDAEELDEEQTESYNYSRSRSRKRR